MIDDNGSDRYAMRLHCLYKPSALFHGSLLRDGDHGDGRDIGIEQSFSHSLRLLAHSPYLLKDAIAEAGLKKVEHTHPAAPHSQNPGDEPCSDGRKLQ